LNIMHFKVSRKHRILFLLPTMYSTLKRSFFLTFFHHTKLTCLLKWPITCQLMDSCFVEGHNLVRQGTCLTRPLRQDADKCGYSGDDRAHFEMPLDQSHGLHMCTIYSKCFHLNLLFGHKLLWKHSTSYDVAP